MKHNAKKILAMLLSFVLVLSLVPAAAAVSDVDIFVLLGEMDDLKDEKKMREILRRTLSCETLTML